MRKQYKNVLDDLASKGWDVRLRSIPLALPDSVRLRYDWIPNDVRQFVEEIDTVVSPDDKAWFVTSTEVSGENGSAFSWNQWELDSLEAAGHDIPRQDRIRAFWDQHFPVMMSVKDGYAYFAIRKQDLAIVCGEEPEYEETTETGRSKSFATFLKKVASGDSQLSRWIMLGKQ